MTSRQVQVHSCCIIREMTLIHFPFDLCIGTQQFSKLTPFFVYKNLAIEQSLPKSNLLE